MEEEIKVRFEELDKRIEIYENRFKDIKVYFTSIISVITLIFSVLIIALNWNFNSEKNDIRQFQKDIRADLGKTDAPANLVLLGVNGKPLDNQDIKAKFIKKDDETIQFTFDYALRNEGMSSSGPINQKVYISDPIKFKRPSIDEPKFKYEGYAHTKNMDPPEIPGGNYIIQYTQTADIENKDIPPLGKYPFLLKVYYGKGRFVCANFNIVFAR